MSKEQLEHLVLVTFGHVYNLLLCPTKNAIRIYEILTKVFTDSSSEESVGMVSE